MAYEKVKARCSVTGKYGAWQVQKLDGDRGKIVGFLVCDGDHRQTVTSELFGELIYEDKRCPTCGKKVACACRRNAVKCNSGSNIHSSCIFCDKLEPIYDNSESEGIVRLNGGEVYKFNTGVRTLGIGVNWDVARSGNSIDVDTTVYMFGDSESEIIYFHNKEDKRKSIIHHGDNVTGAASSGYQNDDEYIDIDLTKVSSSYNRLVFFVNVYDCINRGQNFGTINNLSIRIDNTTSGKPLASYTPRGNYSNDTAVIVGVVYRTNSGWSFKAVGEGTKHTNITEGATYCRTKTF